ncbi:tRNA-dihydrouridine synthase family protein [uncultured Clostridium sp.]|uniref:tRNA dihydrouridine synthase n=1 Tax=uncultured Clostridium sp. TaxID=59620 RepID=UPI0025DE1A61|nr:tRNA-dihydrouridine synthase family protein [uncultured Clostridium sp.]
MKYYLAPMEGITGYIYRNTYEKYFHNVDKYFTPFIIPNKSRSLKTKELIDVLPENNKNMTIVPQILTNSSYEFITTSKKLKELGYNEVNINLGCPSSTVVSKGKGSGFLAKKDELNKFLDEIFKMNDIRISIKTRIGKDNYEEFYDLLKIYNNYPCEELIIHPRTQKDYYRNKPNKDIYKYAISESSNTLCYNGDIFTLEDYNKLLKYFPEIDNIMLGRGILANPGLMDEIKFNKELNKNVLKNFHDEILEEYTEFFEHEKGALFKMKELWSYMIYIFSDGKAYLKGIRTSQSLTEYKEIVHKLFQEQEIVKGSGLFNKIE